MTKPDGSKYLMTLKTQSLSPDVLQIIRDKATERPLSGVYDSWDKPGTYLCRQCGLALFRSQSKFHSGCGWPSFDDELKGTVQYIPDADGRRTEILCVRCHGHLGHVFQGEGMTQKNLRHCVNSLSLDFVPDLIVEDTQEAIFAAGCFWGVEDLFRKLPGVLNTEVGYSGGNKMYPTYEEICEGNTGHFEAIRVLYDPKKISYEKLTQYFFEIHDPMQTDGQGPDIGEQYLSVVFAYDDTQKKIAEELIERLSEKGCHVATRILPVSTFWRAEEYHQNYYAKTGKRPYCHHYVRRF